MALPPDYPEAAKARTEAGAETFFRYYIASLNKAWMTADPAPLAPLREAGCKACAAFESTAAELRQKDQRYASEPASVGQVYPYGDSTIASDSFNVVGDITQNRVDVLDSQGGVVMTDERATAKFLFSLRYVEGRWWLVESKTLQ